MDEDESEQGDDDLLGLLTIGIPIGESDELYFRRRCSKCGRNIESGSPSCPHCGALLH